MSTESRRSAAEIASINAATERKVSVWRTYRAETQNLPNMRDRARNGRNFGALFAVAVGGYFAHTLESGESVVTNVMIGAFTVVSAGLALISEHNRRGRVQQIAEAPQQEAAYAQAVVDHAAQYGLNIRDDKPGDLGFLLRESIANGTPEPPAAPAPAPGSAA